jgi:5-formyltetrahydrofolate cyclo-ligase
MVTMAERKAELRSELTARRRALTAESLGVAALGLADQVDALLVIATATTETVYASVGSEPPTHEIRRRLHARGVRVLLPVVVGDRLLDWAVDEGDDALVPGVMGLREPGGDRLGVAAIGSADLVLAPALAVGPDGQRLGKGAGYYDRALVLLRPGTPVVALLFDHELLDDVPAGAHDHPVDAVVTPNGTVRLSGR